MIRPLRQRHRRIVAALSIALPIALATGIANRRPPPVTHSLPPALQPLITKPPGGMLVWTKSDLWPDAPTLTRLFQAGDGSRTLEITPRPTQPDLLAYWVDAGETASNRLPDDAQLLGPVNLGRIPLPPQPAGVPGRIALYSLANHAVAAVSANFTPNIIAP